MPRLPADGNTPAGKVTDIVDAASSLLERRFLKNAFLPMLLLPLAIFAPVELQGHRLTDIGKRWQQESGTVQVLQVVLAATLVWFAAAILASQWRNIIRLFEGYPLMSVRRIGPACAAWYWKRADELERVGDIWTLYYYYPASADDCLPTRLGNVLRAAERYPYYRYGADTITLWPRLYHLLDRQVVDDVEDARASLEFLLVISLWFAAAGVGGASALLANGNAPLYALGWAGIGVLAAYLSYNAAIWAGVEYGEQLRTSMELYRTALLKQLRIPVPTTLEEERATWNALSNFVSGYEVDTEQRYEPLSAPSAGS